MITILAWIAFTLGGLSCLLNFYLSFLRYPLHRLCGRPRESYRWVSGFPIVGSLLVGLSLLKLHALPGLLAPAVVLMVVDTGGLHWFAGSMLSQMILNKPPRHRPAGGGPDNTGGTTMSPYDQQECCPRFDPQPWDGSEFTWTDRRFVQDRVTSFLHLPLNYGAVMTRNVGPIQAANAFPTPVVILTDENSRWGADVYIEVTRDIPGLKMATISGAFLSRVFEGPYRNVRQWRSEMEEYVRAKGKVSRKLYFFYTTCPKCAKKYGRNYVAILAQV